jgi:hypothetical protein
LPCYGWYQCMEFLLKDFLMLCFSFIVIMPFCNKYCTSEMFSPITYIFCKTNFYLWFLDSSVIEWFLASNFHNQYFLLTGSMGLHMEYIVSGSWQEIFVTPNSLTHD